MRLTFSPASRGLSAAVALMVAAPCAAPRVARAQMYPFSQRATMTQHVAFTTVTLSYGRPVARGRALFGALVPWDSIWHPGADSATRVGFDHDVVVDGHPLRAGEYSLWLIPRAHAPWTLIFNRAAHVFHKPYTYASTEVLRVDLAPERASHVETLTIDFPLVLRDSAQLRIHWGEMAVSVPFTAPYRPPD